MGFIGNISEISESDGSKGECIEFGCCGDIP